jgi:hypothetical protein
MTQMAESVLVAWAQPAPRRFRRGGHAGRTISDPPPSSLRHSMVAELFVHPRWMMSGECGRGQMVGRAKTTDHPP